MNKFILILNLLLAAPGLGQTEPPQQESTENMSLPDMERPIGSKD